MKERMLLFIFPFILAGFSFSNLMGQSAERSVENEISGLISEADSIRNMDPDRSLQVLKLALSLAEENGIEDLQADVEFRLARVYMNKGYYNSALSSGLNALRYYESIGDSSSMGKAKHRIATIHLENGNTQLSRQYDTEALELLDPEKDSLSIAWTQLGLGNYMDYSEEEDSALYHYFLALDMAMAVNDGYATQACYNNIALIYKDKEEYESALSYYQKGIEITRRMEDHSSTAFILDNMGAMYFKMGDLEQALKYSEEAYGMAIEHQTASGLVNIHTNLAKGYAAAKKWDKAFEHQKAYTELIENYFNEKSTASMADMEGKYQNEKKQAEIALLNKENEYKELKIDRQNARQNLMAIGLGLLFVSVVVVVLAYRDKQKTNRLLNAQQDEIRRINSILEVKIQERTVALANVNTELNDLLYRTSHDLRSPITKLMGLVGLAKTNAMPAESVLDHIDGTLEQLNQQNLSYCEIGIIRYHDPKPVRIDIREALEAVIGEVGPKPQNGDSEVDRKGVNEAVCTIDLYLFKIALKEVLANALSFGSDSVTPVYISASKEGDFIQIKVKDNGPGIPEEIKGSLFDLFVKGTNSPNHFGLGLYKARLAVERMGGAIAYLNGRETGTVFKIELPV